ncbi:hypothetical protein M0P48_02200 [Candidatus Gracilibacteria bacterium]|nr:hypothetical protein [Candidatus Gracilibacteria bacterium]
MPSENLCNRGVGEENLVLVHPFYFETDTGLSRDTRTEALIKTYAGKIELLLRGIDRQRFRVVLNDTQSGFRRKTHQWEEEGLLDAVYLDPNGLRAGNNVGYEQFKHSRRNLVAGAYGGRCVNDVMDGIRIMGKAPLFSLTLVRDAVIYRDLIERYLDFSHISRTFGKTTKVSDILESNFGGATQIRTGE